MLGSILGSKSQKKSENTNYKRQQQMIAQALQQLSPANIAQLSQMFMPQIMASQFGIGQTAMHGLQRTLARQGLSQSGIAPSRQLGLSAYLGNQAQQQAFQGALGLAGQRASIFSQQPSQTQPNYNMAAGFQQAIQQGLLAAALQQKPQGPAATYPSYTPNNYGLPSQYGLYNNGVLQ